jgi:hypothetical protein
MPAHCPHCHAVVPEASNFCAACGRRIAGWSAVPDKKGSPEPLVDGEMPTRGMNVTPSMLRAQPKGPQPKGPQASGVVETDSAMMRAFRRHRAPVIVTLVLLAGGAGAGAFLLLRREPAKPVVAQAPPAAPPPAAPEASAPPAAPPATKSVRHSRGPHRAEPVTVGKGGKIIASTAPATKPPRETKGGALPHKSGPTDSKPIAEAPKATAPAPVVDNATSRNAVGAVVNDGVEEATPMTEAEQKQQAEASIDADGVRFVVKAHIAQVHACYGRAFKESSPGGRVEVAFAIDKDGKAVRVRTEANTTESEPLARCLESRIREWQFPRPVGGEYELIYPFQFAAGS